MLPELRSRALEFSDADVRIIEESDIPDVSTLFELNYGKDYVTADVYDGTWVKRCIYGDHIIALVIERDGTVVASGALLLSLGDHNDRSAELARLVVHPDSAGQGLGRKIVHALVEAAENSIEFLESHARTAHLHTQHMLERGAFQPIGYLPQYLGRESLALYMKLLADAGRLRSSDVPHLIPEVTPLARHVLTAVGLPAAWTTADGAAGRRAPETNYQTGALTTRSLDGVLRLVGASAGDRPLFGCVSIDQGLPYIRSRSARYLLALDGHGQPVGAIGLQIDERMRIVKGLELIESDPSVGEFLCRTMVEVAERDYQAKVIEVNVSAYSPRHQRMFWDLGFRPAAYVPAMVFQGTRRLDVVRMVKLNSPWLPHDPGFTKLTDGSLAVMRIVEQAFAL